MNRSEFIIATAIVLFVAFLLGWFAYWLLHRFSRSAGADMNEVERMSRELHEAEDVRDQAIAYYSAREAELINRLHQTEAELQAAMEGLRDARAEAEGLKDYVERSSEPSSFATSRTTLELTDAEHVEEQAEQALYEAPAEPEPEPEPEREIEPVAEAEPESDEPTPETDPLMEAVAEPESEGEPAAGDEPAEVEETEADAAPRRKRKKTKVADDA
jgi:prophage endopeptidase